MYQIICDDAQTALSKMPSESVHIIVTSPPYWGLRDYDMDNQIGTEDSVEEYILKLTETFRECHRVLVNDGVFFLNIGDTYFGYWGNSKCGDELPPSSRAWYNENKRPKFKPSGWKKDKQKVLIPHRMAISLQDNGWIVRNDITWHKPNARPEKVKHRLNCTNEFWFFLCKNARTKRFQKRDNLCSDLWTFSTDNSKNHNATFPIDIVDCIMQQCIGDIVLDPFSGSATTGKAALKAGKSYIGIELNPKIAQESEMLLKNQELIL